MTKRHYGTGTNIPSTGHTPADDAGQWAIRARTRGKPDSMGTMGGVTLWPGRQCGLARSAVWPGLPCRQCGL